MEKFEKGDRVRHKSAGQVMVVKGKDKAGKVICAWLDKNQKKREEHFEEEELESAKRTAPRVGGYKNIGEFT